MALRLVAVDLDGTLIGHDGSIGPKTTRALEKARHMGLHVVIATGRAPRSALGPARFVKANLLAASNGAVVREVETEEVWWTYTIPPHVVEVVIRRLEALSLEVWPRVHTLNEVFVAENDATWATLYTSTYGEACHLVADRLSLVREAVMVGIAGAPDAIDAAEAVVAEAVGALARVRRGNGTSFDVVAPTVDKAWAVKQVAERLGVARSEVVAFGDGPNDAELIAWAGVGVVVGPGCSEIRSVADRVAPERDGVGEVLCELLGGR